MDYNDARPTGGDGQRSLTTHSADRESKTGRGAEESRHDRYEGADWLPEEPSGECRLAA